MHQVGTIFGTAIYGSQTMIPDSSNEVGTFWFGARYLYNYWLPCHEFWCVQSCDSK